MAKRYSEVEKGRLDVSAIQERCQYRRSLCGLSSSWSPVREAWWRETPERWAWLSAEMGIFLSYEDLRKEVKIAGINKIKEYLVEAKLRHNWPQSPHQVYKPDWTSWGDLLGKKFLSYKEASKYAREAGLTDQRQYRSNAKHHKGLPHNPDKQYPEDWAGWKAFLGSRHLTLPALKKAVKKAGVSRETEYRQVHYKLHASWPSNPQNFYEDWVSWPHLFGRKPRKAGRPRKAA